MILLDMNLPPGWLEVPGGALVAPDNRGADGFGEAGLVVCGS